MTTHENLVALTDTLEQFHNKFLYPSVESYNFFQKKIRECKVLSPEDITNIRKSVCVQERCEEGFGTCKITCEDTDSFTMASRLYEEYRCKEQHGARILVLNFANPYCPGGGVRQGVNAQEEDLCRRSSLLLSLESEQALHYYYLYNRRHSQEDIYGNDYGSNTMILTPYVEVIKDKNYELQKEPAKIAVLSVAAPMIRDRQHLPLKYMELLYEKVYSILICAAYFGYTHLVLGAWGCGAFGNDPEIVAGLFRMAIDNLNYEGRTAYRVFKQISFAVPYEEKRPENYLAFKKMF